MYNFVNTQFYGVFPIYYSITWGGVPKLYYVIYEQPLTAKRFLKSFENGSYCSVLNCAREDERADCGDKDSDQTLKKILTNEENITHPQTGPGSRDTSASKNATNIPYVKHTPSSQASRS